MAKHIGMTVDTGIEIFAITMHGIKEHFIEELLLDVQHSKLHANLRSGILEVFELVTIGAKADVEVERHHFNPHLLDDLHAQKTIQTAAKERQSFHKGPTLLFRVFLSGHGFCQAKRREF